MLTTGERVQLNARKCGVSIEPAELAEFVKIDRAAKPGYGRSYEEMKIKKNKKDQIRVNGTVLKDSDAELFIELMKEARKTTGQRESEALPVSEKVDGKFSLLR